MQGKDGTIVFGFFCEISGNICQSLALEDAESAFDLIENALEVVDSLPLGEDSKALGAELLEVLDLLELFTQTCVH